MLSPIRKATVTHVNGKALETTSVIEDDVRQPNAIKEIPTCLPNKATWTRFTVFKIGPSQSHLVILPMTESKGEGIEEYTEDSPSSDVKDE